MNQVARTAQLRAAAYPERDAVADAWRVVEPISATCERVWHGPRPLDFYTRWTPVYWDEQTRKHYEIMRTGIRTSFPIGSRFD